MTAIDRRMLNDEYQARLFTNQIVNLLQDFIPRSCIRDATHKLYDMAIENGLEMTSKAMRREYEAWKLLQLETARPTFIISGDFPGTVKAQGE